jgi:hypothetical protein
MVKRETRAQARALRQQGRSVREIAELLAVSKSSVSTWVRDIELTDTQIENLKENQRRYGAQNAGAKINQRRAEKIRIAYQAEGRARAREGSQLHLIGCMLYWAEGAKARNAIIFTNSDSDMLVLFMCFLREELNIRDDDVRLLIHCHTHDPAEIARIESYWADLLQLPMSCFNQTQIKKGSNTRKNILKNGVCSIRVFNTKLAMHIYGAIQEYGGFDNPDWLF